MDSRPHVPRVITAVAAASPFGYNGRYLYTKVSFVGPSR